MARSPEMLLQILTELPGVEAAYLQPPTDIRIPTPYITYEIDADYVMHADNTVFASFNKFTVTLITRAPDDSIVDLLRALPHSSFDRRFVAAGLHHFVFNIYF